MLHANDLKIQLQLYNCTIVEIYITCHNLHEVDMQHPES